MQEPLDIRHGMVIPAAELHWRFDTSGGPGGQHANKAATRVELSFDLGASPSVSDDIRHRMLERLGGRARNGVVTLSVDESRSQWRNRAIALRRMTRLLKEASRIERPRRKTRPTRASRARRLEAKRRRSETKRLRKRPSPD